MLYDFLQLEIWKRSRVLVNDIYTITKTFPSEERYGLTCQIRRCAFSVPSNIAEGCGRGTAPQLVYFLDIAIGSLCELETQIYLSFDQSFINKETENKIINESTVIRKMTISFQKMLKKNTS